MLPDPKCGSSGNAAEASLGSEEADHARAAHSLTARYEVLASGSGVAANAEDLKSSRERGCTRRGIFAACNRSRRLSTIELTLQCLSQAAAEAVDSAQELVAESKRALKKAEDSCSRLIGTRIAGCLAYRAVLAGFDIAGNCLCRGKARH